MEPHSLGVAIDMIPDNPLIYDIDSTNKFLVAPFQYPDNISSSSELVDYEMGGLAIQNPSKGLRYQMWKGWWDSTDSTAYLEPEDTGIAIPIHTASNVEEFCFTFDQNMRWSTACRFSGDTVEHRWYDTSVAAYVTTTYPSITSVRLALDDKRDMQVQLGGTDMIMTYISGGQVKWRIQRDRFLTEYIHPGPAISESFRISHFGMSTKNRLQWRIGPRRIQT